MASAAGPLHLCPIRTETPQPVRLVDYRPPAYLIDEVFLDFSLEPAATRVKARLGIRRNGDHSDPLVLDGDGLKTISVAVDGKPHAFEETPEALRYATSRRASRWKPRSRSTPRPTPR